MSLIELKWGPKKVKFDMKNITPPRKRIIESTSVELVLQPVDIFNNPPPPDLNTWFSYTQEMFPDRGGEYNRNVLTITLPDADSDMSDATHDMKFAKELIQATFNISPGTGHMVDKVYVMAKEGGFVMNFIEVQEDNSERALAALLAYLGM